MSPGIQLANSIRTVNAVELVLWVLRRRRRFRVVGDSMSPSLKEGDVVLIAPIQTQALLIPGAVVLCRHPYIKATYLIKRIDHIDQNGGLFVHGDNKTSSTDSRSFGSIAQSSVIGLVSSTFARKRESSA
jgi:nickel-type superoxide dismutase maturation protease